MSVLKVGRSFVRGVNLNDQRLPDGPEYVRLDNVSKRIARARRQIRAWDDAEHAEAKVMLDIYEGVAGRGQEELFARRDDLPMDPALRDRVWALLEGRIA